MCCEIRDWRNVLATANVWAAPFGTGGGRCCIQGLCGRCWQRLDETCGAGCIACALAGSSGCEAGCQVGLGMRGEGPERHGMRQTEEGKRKWEDMTVGRIKASTRQQLVVRNQRHSPGVGQVGGSLGGKRGS